MADDSARAEDDAGLDELPAAPQAKRSYLTAAVIGAGLLGGGGFGALVGGPLLVKRLHAPAAAAATAPAAEGKAQPPSTDSVVLMDNLVLNPAGSGGLRFLLVTVGLDVSTTANAAALKLRDAEVRDVLLRIFSARRVEELADIGLREPLKREIATAIDAILASKAVKNVYFPQYVIQ